jgi:hypothetical protein
MYNNVMYIDVMYNNGDRPGGAPAFIMIIGEGGALIAVSPQSIRIPRLRPPTGHG